LQALTVPPAQRAAQILGPGQAITPACAPPPRVTAGTCSSGTPEGSMTEYHLPEPPSRFAFPVAKAGYPLIYGSAFATLVLALLQLTAPALFGLAATIAIAAFFRDPDRVVPSRPGLVVSPADGRVIAVDVVHGTPFRDAEVRKISIFMSVFNVHVNRMPVSGSIRQVAYRPGTFLAADRKEASMRNEHNAVTLETEDGSALTVVQVAGLIARRIICHVQPGDSVQRGQRFGMICFGSRLDVYLPLEVEPKVAVGDTVCAGSSILGQFLETPAG
jgi:phosphatidylserine decarboxylase